MLTWAPSSPILIQSDACFVHFADVSQKCPPCPPSSAVPDINYELMSLQLMIHSSIISYNCYLSDLSKPKWFVMRKKFMKWPEHVLFFESITRHRNIFILFHLLFLARDRNDLDMIIGFLTVGMQDGYIVIKLGKSKWLLGP